MHKSVVNAVLGLLTTTSFTLSLPVQAHAVVANSEPVTSVTGTTFSPEPIAEDQVSQSDDSQLVAELVEVCDYYYDYYGNIYYYCEYYAY